MDASCLIQRVAPQRTQLVGGFSNPLSKWEICLHNRYPAYITWEEIVANQAQLRTNSLRYREERPGVARKGCGIPELVSLVPDHASHVKAIEHILHAYQHSDAEQNAEIVKFLRELSQKRTLQMHTSAHQIAADLLQYIKADARSEGRMKAATALLEKVAHFPSFPSALSAQIYSDRGWAYLHLKDSEQAISDFNRALELKPDFAWAFGSRGLTFHFLRDYDRAIADFNRAIELNPKYTWAYGSRGQTYRMRKDYDRAIADFDRAIEIGRDYAWAFEQRGRAYNSLKLPPVLLSPLQWLKESRPDFYQDHIKEFLKGHFLSPGA